MLPAIILARVSTPEQEAGHSLEAQLANLEQYATRCQLEVIQIFRIIESSTKGYRPEFERMIEFLKKQRTRHALIVDCVDRLQRSFTHTPVLNALMEQDLLEVHFVREGNVIDRDANSMQKMMWNMGTVMAQSYTDQLSDNVKRSIQHKLEKGEWIAMAPLGYLNTVDHNTGKSHIVIDPIRAPLVQRLFNDYASGVYSMAELARKSKEWGLLSRKSNKPLNIQTVAGILNNPFYSGLMRIKGKLYPHNYPRLVDALIFQACERRKRNNRLPQQAIRITRHPFVLRGLVTCATSGRKATCALQKKQYIYLMVRNPSDPKKILWIKEDAVINQITETLRTFTMPQDLLTDVLDYIEKTDAQEIDLNKTTAKELQAEQARLAERQSRLTDLLIDGTITKAIFESKNRELQFQRHVIEDRLGVLAGGSKQHGNRNNRHNLAETIKILSNSAELFMSSKTDQKREMLGFVFSNLSLEGGSLRYSLRKPFEVLRQVPKIPEWRALVDSNH